MPLNRRNTRLFTRILFAGQLQKIRLLKRNDDQQQGTVIPYILFGCRRGQITKTGETYVGNMTSDNRVTWHIPRYELDRVGINYLNPTDRIEDIEYKTGTWQPESTTGITEKLWGNEVDIDTLKVSN